MEGWKADADAGAFAAWKAVVAAWKPVFDDAYGTEKVNALVGGAGACAKSLLKTMLLRQSISSIT